MGNGNSSQRPARNQAEVRTNRQSAFNSERAALHRQSQRIPNNSAPLQAPPRQVPTQTISANKKYDILAHINKQSILATASKHHQGRTYITFQYDAKEECTITLYYFGIEVMDRAYSTQYIWADIKKYPTPVGFKLPAGLKQSFPSKKCFINTSSYPEDLLTHKDKKTYPLIIEIKPFIKTDSVSETTYVVFSKKSNGELKAKAIKQKIHKDGKSFELDLVYGYDNEHSDAAALEEHTECVICMITKPDTAIIPCRHLCLCNTCAGLMRNQNCPICRGGKDYFRNKETC